MGICSYLGTMWVHCKRHWWAPGLTPFMIHDMAADVCGGLCHIIRSKMSEMTVNYGVLSEGKCEKCEGSIPDGVELSE
jgi:hypothetical protein